MSDQTIQEQPQEPETPAGPPPLTAEEINGIVQDNQTLQQALDQDPSIQQEIEVIIREHLQGEATPATINTLLQTLNLYLDDACARYLLTMLTKRDDAPYLEQVKKAQTSAGTWNWIRRLLALYGNGLQEANAIGGMDEGSWRTINRRVYYDVVIGQWGVSLDLIKYNGERITLSETIPSVLSLVNGLLDTLNRLPPDVAANFIAQDIIQQFSDNASRLLELYTPAPSEESAETETK
jgi:hypothetical protein